MRIGAWLASFALWHAALAAAQVQQRWTSAPPMHYTRAAHAVVSDGRSIYALAGTGAGGVPVVVFERFEDNAWRDEGSIPGPGLATNAWSDGPKIEPRGTAGAVVYCGAIHVFGGESQAQRKSLGDVLRLNRNGAWQPLSAMPTPRNFARAVIFDDAVYVVGGSPTPEASHASTGSAIVERFRVPCGG